MIRSTLFATFVAAFLFAVSSVHAEEKPAVKLIQEPTAIRVEIDGKPFTTYHFADGGGKPYVRPFLFPVRAADGAEVTSDQATGGGDHPHHRSIWVAHGNVNGADHWSLLVNPPPQQRHVKFVKVEGDTIVEELAWEGKTPEPILNETRTIRFFAWPDGSRGIDLTLVFTPVAEPITFADTKEAGLCSVRMAKSIAKKPTILNSTGATGEKACWGKPAQWCDESGEVDGKTYGIAILDHPTNPRHPATWHVRAYGLMTANIFGLHDYNPKQVAKDAGNLTITKDKPVTFKYRVVIHAGDGTSAKLAEKFAEFAR